ncbi:MAG: HDOD domain-containing protein [Candidatus Eisenbacteria bacterium]|nr:HDOD domain-containing protein [Candidatus Eisenbacteria bacterium]
MQYIAAIPPAASKALDILMDPDVDLPKVIPCLEFDPGLTSNLLRLVNSPYFGFQRDITSVREACIRLGIRRVRDLVVASVVGPIVRQSIKGYSLESCALWEHSVATAIASEKLSGALGIQMPFATFTSAILHDVGKIVMGTFVEIGSGPIMRLSREQGLDFNKAEQQILGTDHAEVGAALLHEWSFPQIIVDVVRWHHDPEEAPEPSISLDIVHCADGIAIILVTHEMDIAVQADRMLHMRDGLIVEDSVVDEQHRLNIITRAQGMHARLFEQKASARAEVIQEEISPESRAAS